MRDIADASGNPIANPATHAEAVDQLFHFQGRELDETTGLQNNRARWYDAATGRFLSEDPIAFNAGDPNLYRYAANNPVTNTDPTGLRTLKPYDTLPALGSLGPVNPYSTASFPTPRNNLPTVDQSLRQLNQSIGTFDYYSSLGPVRGASIAQTPTVRAPSIRPTATVRAPSPPSSGLFDFIYDTVSNYPSFLTTELSAAGQTIVDTGRATGDFIGDHVSQLYYDPGLELERARRGRDAVGHAIVNTTVNAYQNPLGAASRVGSATVDYLDRLTSDPNVSGQFVGQFGVGLATGPVAAAGRQTVARGLTAGSELISQVDVANALRSLRVTNNPATRFGGVRLTAPKPHLNTNVAISNFGVYEINLHFWRKQR